MVEINTEIDPKDMEAASSMWQSFTRLIKRCSMTIVIFLILMALFVV